MNPNNFPHLIRVCGLCSVLIAATPAFAQESSASAAVLAQSVSTSASAQAGGEVSAPASESTAVMSVEVQANQSSSVPVEVVTTTELPSAPISQSPSAPVSTSTAEKSANYYSAWPASYENRIDIDGAPMYALGAGLSYHRILSSHWTLGPRINYHEVGTSQSENSSLDMIHKFSVMGFSGTYYFNGVELSSLYLSAGYEMIYDDVVAKIGSAKSTSTSSLSSGPYAATGYQFRLTKNLLLKLGAIYEHGYAVETKAQSINGGPTEITENQIRANSYVETILGVVF